MSGRPLKVVFIITGLGRGGAERQLVRLVTHLDRERFEPRVMSLLPPVAHTEELREHDVPFSDLGMTRGRPSLKAAWTALAQLRVHRPDVIVAFMVHSFLLARFLGRLAGAPAIVSSVRTEKTYRQPYEALTALTDRLSFATVVNASSVAQAVVRRGAVSPGKVRVIFNAVSFSSPPLLDSTLRAAVRDELGIESDAFVWTSVARLVPEKDHSTLVAAFERVVAIYPSSRLLLVGDGERRDAIAEDLLRRGLTSQVRCLGNRDDVERILAISDAFVLSSHFEGSPNALIEAMAAGLPSVASRVGGVDELIPTPREGWVVEPGNAVALREAMLKLMALPPDARASIGRKAQDRVRAAHAMPQIVAQWQDLICEAHAQRRGIWPTGRRRLEEAIARLSATRERNGQR